MSEKITADLAKWSMSEISKDALNSIRFRCEARMPFQASEVLPLIAEVERLRALLRAACADPESQPSLEAWATIRREFGKKEGGA